MPLAGELTAVEAAYLASACVEASRREDPAPDRVLADVAFKFDLDAAPVSLRAVRKAVEEGVVRSRNEVRLLLDVDAVLYLASTKSFETASLSREAKVKIYDVIRSGRDRVELAPLITLELGPLLRVGRRLHNSYAGALARYVVKDPEIMGGVPVIAGTRIPVYTILGRADEGESMVEIARDFDHVPREALEAALAYARTHPRRGRPTRFR